MVETQVFTERDIYDQGAERAFLACIMNHPELANLASILVSPADIYGSQNSIVYKAILFLRDKMSKNGFTMKYDASSIISAMKDMKCLSNFTKQIGGLEYLSNIQVAPCDKDSFEFYVDTIRTRSARVHMFREATRLQHRAVNDLVTDNFDIISNSGRIMQEIAESFCKKSTIIKLGDMVPQVLGEYKNCKEAGRKSGLQADFCPRFMDILHGFRRRQFIVLFARPKVGKSTFLMNIAIDVALQNIPVLYIDTEMSPDEQASRVISRCSGIREWDLMDGVYLDDEGKKKIVDDVTKIFMASPFYYTPARGMSTDEIVSKMREFKEKYVGTEMIGGVPRTKQCLIIYDWLKVAEKDSLQNIKEYQELGYIATKINDTISELDVPIICGAQANRFGNDKGVGVKSASHAQNFLADSDRLLRFCTCLAWLRRLNVEEQEIANKLPKEQYFNQMVHIVDQRKGPTCMEGICLQFIGENLTYKEVEHVNLEEHSVNESTGAKDGKQDGEQKSPFDKC
jgi:replicative DNA helicase